jgi:hypothetical protein
MNMGGYIKETCTQDGKRVAQLSKHIKVWSDAVGVVSGGLKWG